MGSMTATDDVTNKPIDLVDMTTAADRIGIRRTSVIRSLRGADIKLYSINRRNELGVSEKDLASYIASRGDFSQGRPKKKTASN